MLQGTRWIRPAAVAAVVAGALLGAPSVSASAEPAPEAPPSKLVDGFERARTTLFDIGEIARSAKPMLLSDVPRRSGERRQRGPEGETLRIEGALPLGDLDQSVPAATPAAVASTTYSANGLWGGSYFTNPNRQVGKLYYDVQRGLGEDWRHCTATAVNSENKSFVLTAGHCVFSPDPDGNGYITGNGYWHEHVQFCPGYEYACKLGTWYSRQISTTDSWFYGSGSPRRYDWSDDVAVVLVSPNASGYLVNAVGGQGITFNIAAGLYRTSLGYPAPDRRFPTYANTYNGEDLIHCPAYDQPDWYGRLVIPCTMTGGASGGPWITNPAANWIGYVNSVNSHKPSEGTMGGPYFGAAESNLFQYWRSR